MSLLDGSGSMSPDTAWTIGATAVALITTGPAYIAARKSRGAAREEGATTRDALNEVAAQINGRIEGLNESLRADIAEIRDWQAAHTTEHAVSAFQQMDPHPRLERRNKE